jgi:4-alpha-glucanotransferase
MPLFSAASTASWGIGEIDDVGPLSTWLSSAGFDRLMLLPIGTMHANQTSPYSASSAMAIDPLYISIGALVDFVGAGGTDVLSIDAKQDLDRALHADRVRYAPIRRVKQEALRLAFARFVHAEWVQLTPRGSQLARFIARERWWLDDHALFQTLGALHPAGTWRDWPAPLRDRDPRALVEARRQHARDVLFHQYVQWTAAQQWQAARAAAEASGVTIIGDLPFVVDLHSADVWARADEFFLDVSLGVPPDAFSQTGQDWGLPVYRWDVVASRNFAWIRQRARRMAALFGGFRVDHLVGFYRTYGRPTRGDPFFIPADEPSQIRLGETVLQILRESGAAILAEDLGTIPDFVRASLARRQVPGCKVLRWEREWDVPGQPFVDPASYTPVSAALTGTHDTETLAGWWDHADPADRQAFLNLPRLQAHGISDITQPWNNRLRDGLLDLSYHSGSSDLYMPIQDLFGWRDRINVPGTVSEANWSWRLPWAVDTLKEIPEAAERASFCTGLAGASGRD